MFPSPSRQVRRAQARRAGKTKASRGVSARRPVLDPSRIPRRGWIIVALVVLVAAIAGVAITSHSGSSSQPPPLTGSGYPNVNSLNTRYVGGPINSHNVSQLQEAWSVPLTARSEYGSYSSAPVVSGGVVYSQDLNSNVQAIDLQSGRVIWTKSYESPDQGPNGIVVQAGRVYGATTTSIFALDGKTGRQLWSVTLARNENEGIDMAPGYHDGAVYVSTVPGNTQSFYKGQGVGVLWALDAKTGRRLWHFDTVPEDLWSPSAAGINSGGGLWYSPAFDDSGGMYIGTGNPAPFPGTNGLPWGESRPGADLYTDSIVKLDSDTGKVEWYYQLTPHDLYDHDLQDPPILQELHGRQIVLAAGKGGIVIALDAGTGRLLWKRAVGIHNGHDSDNLYALHQEYGRLHLPETVYPGYLGGVIAPMASNGSTLFVPVVNDPVVINSQSETQEPGPTSGGLVALDVATGKPIWHQKLSSPAFGAVTAVNDLVFATTAGGTLYAYEASSGHLAWEQQLSAGTNTGVAVQGATLIAPAGLASSESQTTQITAYRLPAGK
jgi:outer membrane protein assembly factor BamB